MYPFKDLQGREWKIPKLTVSVIDRVAADTGLDLAKAFENEQAVLKKISSDFRVALNLVWHLIKPDAEKQGVDVAAFNDAVDYDVIDQACEALLDAISDFFPAATRKKLAAAKVKGKELQTEMEKRGDKLMDAIDVQTIADGVERKAKADLDKLLSEISGGSSTNAPESPASIPSHSA